MPGKETYKSFSNSWKLTVIDIGSSLNCWTVKNFLFLCMSDNKKNITNKAQIETLFYLTRLKELLLEL